MPYNFLQSSNYYIIVTAFKMNKHTRKLYLAEELTGEEGPSVESNEMTERIAARRLRIENRVMQSK